MRTSFFLRRLNTHVGTVTMLSTQKWCFKPLMKLNATMHTQTSLALIIIIIIISFFIYFWQLFPDLRVSQDQRLISSRDRSLLVLDLPMGVVTLEDQSTWYLWSVGLFLIFAFILSKMCFLPLVCLISLYHMLCSHAFFPAYSLIPLWSHRHISSGSRVSNQLLAFFTCFHTAPTHNVSKTLSRVTRGLSARPSVFLFHSVCLLLSDMDALLHASVCKCRLEKFMLSDANACST